jgi:hypothetical protein
MMIAYFRLDVGLITLFGGFLGFKCRPRDWLRASLVHSFEAKHFFGSRTEDVRIKLSTRLLAAIRDEYSLPSTF